MPTIVCQCGAVHAFTDTAAHSRAGTKFTCTKCGRTRRLPTRRSPQPSPSASTPVAAAKRRQWSWLRIVALLAAAGCLAPMFVPRFLFEHGPQHYVLSAIVGISPLVLVACGLIGTWKWLAARNVPLLKRWVVMATLIWPISIAATFFIVFAKMAGNALTEDNDWIINSRGGLVHRDDALGAATMAGALYGLACPTIVYGMALLGLLVFWWATKRQP